MTSEYVQATRWTCDNPSCGITRLSEDEGVPVGWFMVVFRAVNTYCSRACIEMHVERASVQQRDSGGGWIVSSLVPAVAA